MLHKLKLAGIMWLLAISSIAVAQVDGPTPEVVYDRTQALPSGKAFYAILGSLALSPNAATIVAHELKVSSDEATVIVAQFQNTLQKLEGDIKLATSAYACSLSDSSSPANVLYDMYDISEGITNAAYNDTRINLDSRVAARLEEWVNETKSNMGSTRIDMKAALATRSDEARDLLGSICRGEIGK